jgi:hypothetical protein
MRRRRRHKDWEEQDKSMSSRRRHRRVQHRKGRKDSQEWRKNVLS